MRIDPMKKNSIAFVTTNACTAYCDHCLMCCAPGEKKYLTFEMMKKSIDELIVAYHLEQVIFTGGEPTLLGDELFRTIRYCTDRGLLTRMVTNAHWADTYENARAYIRKLRAAGLNELNMSCDDFHAPYVPMEHIKNAWHASKGMGFHSVCIANCQNSHPVVDQEYIINLLGERPNNIWDMDQRYGWKERTYEKDEYGTMYLLSSSYMQRTGRAGEVFSEEEFEPYHDTTALERAACGGVGSQGSISYDNHLWACCGLQSSGNPVLDVADLNTVPVVDAMKKVADNVILTAIHTVGPYALIRFVKEMDPSVTFKDQYFSLCEMCGDLTTNEKAVNILNSNLFTLFKIIKESERLVAEGKINLIQSVETD